MPFTTPALIAAGGSLFGNVLSNIFGSSNQSNANQANYRIAQMNNQFNERMLEKQMMYNDEMWNKQNAYNDPSAQRARLEAAGINPYLAMQGGNSAGTASGAMGVNPPTAQGVQMQAYKPNLDMSGFNQAMQMLYQKRQVDATTQGQVLQNERQWIDNMFAMQEHLNNLAHSAIDYKTKQKMMNIYERQYVNMGYEGELAMAQRRYYDRTSEGIELENTYRSIRNENAPEMFKLQISQMANDILYKKAQTKMTETQTKHELEKMIETQARTAGLKISNKQAAAMASDIIRTARYNANKAFEEAYRAKQPQNMWQWTDDTGAYIRHRFEKNTQETTDKLIGSWKKFKKEFRIPGIF